MNNMAINIVTIGGGTGTHMLLSGLKKYVPEIELSAIVSVADDGGSTGRLRDVFGYLPVGDFRMALAALSSDTHTEALLRDLFQYRFAKGEGLVGHSFGNLLLVALTDMLGSEEQALLAAGKLLHAHGTVIPVSGEKLHLLAEYDSGHIVRGESLIDVNHDENMRKARIVKTWVEPEVPASRFAKETIHNADYILLGPGDLYTSTIANLVVPGIKEAFGTSSAKIILLGSLMTKRAQTNGMHSVDFQHEIERYIGRPVDYVLLNSALLPSNIVELYATEGEYPVKDTHPKNNECIVRSDLLQKTKIQNVIGDEVRRSLIRHDSHKTAAAIMEIVMQGRGS